MDQPVVELSTSELAAAAGVHIETLRYYERRGLLPEPPRSPAGYRRYPASDVERLRFIARAKALGFTLAEITALLDDVDPAASPEQEAPRVHAAVATKLAAVDAQIQELGDRRQQLERL